MLAKSFRDLDVYRQGRKASKRLFLTSKDFPREEMHSLTDQIRRCSRAVGALIAEAWGRRRYPASFANKLSDALGEVNEVQAWLDSALDCEYINETDYFALDREWQEIGGRLARMIEKHESFCAPGR